MKNLFRGLLREVFRLLFRIRIVGMPEGEALRLLEELLEHAVQEKYQYRHRWKKGDLVLWDNRCLLHKANGDYDHSQTRYLYRVMLQDGAAA